MKSAQELTANCFIPNKWSAERKMPPITMHVVTTLLERKWLTLSLIESVNCLITALDYKVSWSSTPSVVVLDLDSPHCWWSVFQLITARSQSLNSPFTQPHKSPLLLLSHTTQSWPPTPPLNIPIALLWLTMKPFTTSADETSTLNDQPTPTWTDWLDKLFLPSLLLWDSMVLWMSIWTNSKPTWYHTQESISHWSHMHQSSQLKRLTTNSSQLPRSPMLALSQPTKWSNVILVTESTCHAVCCTEEMLCQKMSMLPLPLSRPRDPSNLLIGAQP